MSNLNAKSINVGRLNITENTMYHRGREVKMLDQDASGNLCLTNSIFSNEPFKLGINICPGTTVTDVSANQTLNAALDVSGGLQLAFNDVTTMPTPGNLGSISFFKDGSGNYRFYGCEQTGTNTGAWRAITESHAQTSYWSKNADDLYYSNGKVGIGKNNPTFRLDVASGANVNSMKLDDIMSWNCSDGIGTPSRCRFLSSAMYADNVFWQFSPAQDSLLLLDRILTTDGTTPYNIKFATQTFSDVTFEFGASGQTGKYIFNGNVGIGTDSPDYLLDVSGNAGTIQSSLCRGKDPHFKTVTWSSNSNLEDAVVGAIGLYYNANEASMVKFHRGVYGEDGFMSFTTGVYNTTTGGQERMRLDNLGRLGIGTTTPQAKLDVSGDVVVGNRSGGATAFTGITISNTSTNTTSNCFKFNHRKSNGNGVPEGYITLQDQDSSGQIVIRPRKGGGTCSQLILNGNNGAHTVGINYDPNSFNPPSSPFSNDQLALAVNGNILIDGGTGKKLIFGRDSGTNSTAIIQYRSGIGNGLKFLTGESGATPSTKMVIMGNGNIGIGQPPDNNGDNWSGSGSPYHGLSANVDVGISGELYADKSVYIGYDKWNTSASELSANSLGLYVKGDISCNTLRDASGSTGNSGEVLSSTGGGLKWVDPSGHGQWTNTSTGSGLYYIGNVGIGTTDPSGALDVAGTVTAISFNATSDLNKKENIDTILNATEKMTFLRGVSYNLKSDKNKKKHYGVIAQELEKIFPDMVNGEEGNKSVAYMEIIGVLIETVKDLNKRIENLEQSSSN